MATTAATVVTKSTPVTDLSASASWTAVTGTGTGNGVTFTYNQNYEVYVRNNGNVSNVTFTVIFPESTSLSDYGGSINDPTFPIATDVIKILKLDPEMRDTSSSSLVTIEADATEGEVLVVS